MNLKLKATLAAVAMAFAANSANAASSASATLGQINVTLIDLNPTDSIAPTITWANSYYGYGDYAYTYAYDTAASNYQQNYTTWGTNNFTSIASSSATAQSSVQAGVVSGGDDSKADGATLSVSGNAQGTTTAGQYSYFNGYSYAPYYSYSQFTLGAYTGVIFSAAAKVDATTTEGYQTGWGSEYASAYSQLNVWGTAAGGNSGSQSSSDSLSASANYTSSYAWNSETNQYDYTYAGQQQNLNATLAVSYINFTDLDKVGNIQSTVSNYGTSYVQAVPEPNSYAMLLAGIGLIGFMVRRRM